MELDKRNIEEYINRFLEGETTNAEEQAIYRFFHTGERSKTNTLPRRSEY